MSPAVKPIETRYKGYRFRSRLEARWAVYFDALGIDFEYEKEGYDLGELGLYLPDFWLPQVGMFAEVKPVRFSEVERSKCLALPSRCLMLDGLPGRRSYWNAVPYSPGPFSDNNREQLPFPSDYIIDNYYLDEHRFFSNTGAAHPDGDPDWLSYFDNWDFPEAAIETALSARFEHLSETKTRKR